jgi:hypothetical protein
MHQIDCLPDKTQLSIGEGETILEASLRAVDFMPQKLSIELDRPRDNLVSVTFAMAATGFAEASQVVKIISGEIELP